MARDKRVIEIREKREAAQRSKKAFEQAALTEDPAGLATRFFAWLRREGLDQLNYHLMQQEPVLAERMIGSSAIADKSRRDRLLQLIKSTELPKPE